MKGEVSGGGSLLQAQAEFTALLHFLREDSQTEEISQVEKQIFSRLLDLGRSLLEVYVAQKGTGYVGPIWEQGDGSRWMCQGIRSRAYLSVFGPIQIRRSYYYAVEKGEGGCPLDQQLHLPERKNSYLL